MHPNVSDSIEILGVSRNNNNYFMPSPKSSLNLKNSLSPVKRVSIPLHTHQNSYHGTAIRLIEPSLS